MIGLIELKIKQITKIIAIIVLIIVSLSAIRTIYIEIISHKISSETAINSADYFSKIKDITENCGYSMSSTEPFDGAGTYEEAYKFKSDNFEFNVCISNWHDVVEYVHVYFIDNNDCIDYKVLLKVFNSISACNISKYRIMRCHKSLQNKSDYEKNLILFSDKCSIYGSSEDKSICITGVPGLGI